MSSAEEAVIRVEAEIPHLATKEMLADVRTEIAEVRTEIGQTEIRLIKWIIGTGVVAVLTLSAQLWGAVQLLRVATHV